MYVFVLSGYSVYTCVYHYLRRCVAQCNHQRLIPEGGLALLSAAPPFALNLAPPPPLLNNLPSTNPSSLPIAFFFFLPPSASATSPAPSKPGHAVQNSGPGFPPRSVIGEKHNKNGKRWQAGWMDGGRLEGQ